MRYGITHGVSSTSHWKIGFSHAMRLNGPLYSTFVSHIAPIVCSPLLPFMEKIEGYETENKIKLFYCKSVLCFL